MTLSFKGVRTPAFLADLNKVEKNCRRMIRMAREKGVALRPHVKTHKTAQIARLQLGEEFTGITVSTMAEAAFFLENGFEDITYAFPITPNKFHEAAGITQKAKAFHLLLDHQQTFEALQGFAKSNGIVFSVFLKVDPGYHRAGVNPNAEESRALAIAIQKSSNLEFKGILTHGGHSYSCRSIEEIKSVADQERSVLVEFAQTLKDCPVISAGSTPTAILGDSWEGVTELRPGNYSMFDKFQVDMGVCSLNDCAGMVLTTVAGLYPSRNGLLVDAGALALSKDTGASHLNKELVFGSVVGHPNLKIVSLSQEHGLIQGAEPIDFKKYPIGTQLRIIPNHVCMTAALFPSYFVTRDNEIVDEWIPVRGW